MAKKMFHDTLQPYPTDLNSPVDVLLAKVSGEDVPLPCCVHAAHQATGVILGRLYPDESGDAGMRSSVSCPCPTDEEAKALLEQCKGMRGPISDMLLQQLLAFFMAKLTEWLKK